MEFLNLPEEILILICTMLDSGSRIQLSRTCQLFNDIISEKKLVAYTDLSNIFGCGYNDLQFVVKHKFRRQNIRILNIDGWYWIPRHELYNAIKKLSNLTELYALGTKLRMRDIYFLMENLPNLSIISFTVSSSETLEPAELKQQEKNFKRLSKIYAELCCTAFKHSLLLRFLTDICGDKFYPMYVTHLLEHTTLHIHDHVWANLTSYFIQQRSGKPFVARLFSDFKFDAFNDSIQNFLPDFTLTQPKDVSELFIYPYKALYDMKNDSLQTENIKKLCLFHVDYNFKGKLLGNAFLNLRELCLNSVQLYDEKNEKNFIVINEFKKMRVGTPTSVINEKEHPICKLAEACPNLEVLCIKGTRNTRAGTNKIWYPSCLSFISSWVHLKRLSLDRVESINGQFLRKVSECCQKLTHLSLSLISPRSASNFFIKDLCESLNEWKSLVYLYVHFSEARFEELFVALSKCVSLKVIILINDDKNSKIGMIPLYDLLHSLISSLDDLFMLHIVDNTIPKRMVRTVGNKIRSHFRTLRPRLVLHIGTQNRVDNMVSCIVGLEDPRKLTYWLI